MQRLHELLRSRISTEASDLRFGQAACFGASLLVLVVGLLAVTRLTASNGELLLGVLGTLSLSVQLVVLGAVAPLAARRPDA